MEHKNYTEYLGEEEKSELKISIHMQDYCPYSCAMCMYASGPHRPESRIDLNILNWLRDQFGGGWSVWKDKFSGVSLNLVGGEPVYNDLGLFDYYFREIMDVVDACGMSWEMTTNGWWLEDPKNVMRVLNTVAPFAEAHDTYVRISDSPWHDPHRSKALKRILSSMLAGRENDNNAFNNVLEDAAEYWGDIDDIEVSVDSDHPDYEDEWNEAYCKYMDSLPFAIPGSENFYVDSIGRGRYVTDPLSKISPTGRGLKLGGYQKPTCDYWESDMKMTILPNGDMRDFCCNGGGLLRQGKVWDKSVDEWMELMYSFYSHLEGCGADCAKCPKNTRDWAASIKQADMSKMLVEA